MRALGTLGGRESLASGINDAGQVVGWSYTEEGLQRAFITGPDGWGMRDLGTLNGRESAAIGINDAGQVIGWSRIGGSQLAFITGPDGTGMRDLGTLGGPRVVYGINDAGQAVGLSHTTEGDPRAFITGPDGVDMKDLNSLVDLPPGVTLHLAGDINNVGQVIATAIPEPESYALLLAGLALVGAVSRR